MSCSNDSGLYNFTVQRLTSFEPVDFLFRVNGSPMDLTGVTALVQFRKAPGKPVFLEWGLGTGLTVVSPATSGILRFDTPEVDIAAGEYVYDLYLQVPSGKKTRYLFGTMTVQDVITIP